MKKKRIYNLSDIHKNESALQRYRRLTVGEDSRLTELLLQEFVLGLCAGLPGMAGWGVRNKVYPFFFRNFSKKTFVGSHVTLRCPRNIHFSGNVVIDDFVQLIATSKEQKAIKIGDGSFLRSFSMLNSGTPEGYIHIGTKCSIGQGALLYGNGGLIIGNNVMIAGQTSIIASSHIYEDESLPMVDQGYTAKGIRICDNVWIGSGARILDGVTIGEGVIIGANAVVNRSIAPKQRVAGVPARIIESEQTIK